MEEKFKTTFGKKYKVDFSDNLSSFLGLNIQQVRHNDGELTVYLDQGHSILNLIAKAGLDKPGTASKKTPYRSGHPVDSIENQEMSEREREKLNKILQEYVGELNWLSTQTRPDISTITNIIAQYNSKCSKGHIDAAKYVIHYLLGTKNRGICFSSRHNSTLEAFVKFPIDPTKIYPVTDANWGPQDASKPDPNKTYPKLDLFKSRSIAGFVIWFGGPLHWQAKRQGYTARSSGESEVGSVDNCTQVLQLLRNILKDLGLYDRFVKEPITIYNDNRAAVDWSHNMTSKGMSSEKTSKLDLFK